MVNKRTKREARIEMGEFSYSRRREFRITRQRSFARIDVRFYLSEYFIPITQVEMKVVKGMKVMTSTRLN